MSRKRTDNKKRPAAAKPSAASAETSGREVLQPICAPVPVRREERFMMPGLSQEFVIRPRLRIEQPRTEEEEYEAVSTECDYQPKAEDRDSYWKRRLRTPNVIAGLLVLLATAAVLLPYILAAAKVSFSLPFKYIFEQYDVVGSIMNAVNVIGQSGLGSEAARSALLGCVPSLILAVGIIALAVNLIKSLAGIFGAVKPKKYSAGAAVYLIAVLIVFVLSLMGWEELGVQRVDVLNDVIKGYATSELFTLIALGVGYAAVCGIAALINPVRTGYKR